jgi:prepilin-type N-terminal cleavage/methylation domain-containing protein
MKKPASLGAFTLIELLVSSAILAIVMLVLLTSVSTGLSLWRGTDQKIAVDREGRTAMHLLAEDLAGIVNLTDAGLQPRFEVSASQDIPVTPLRFLTLKPLDFQTNTSDVGDVCFVEYRYENNALRRATVGSSNTFLAIKGGNLPTVSAGDFEIVATNLLQFRVWAWDAAGNPALGSAARVVDYFMEVVDQKGMENFRRDINAPNALLIGQQYFSGRAAVPPPR